MKLRKAFNLLCVAACGLALAFASCDSDGDGGDPDTGPAGDTAQGDEGPPPKKWQAVMVVDTFDGQCKSTNAADGANIDAVGLFDSALDELGYLGHIRFGDLGTDCDNDYTDETEALGAPDGTLLENYFTLQGGYLLGEFVSPQDPNAGSLELAAGDTITVYEVGKAAAGKDDPYDVYVAIDMTCGGDARPADTEDCLHKVGDGAGEGNFVVPDTIF